MNPSIFFIGTGITSALTCSFIQKNFPRAKIILCDKARGAGGRMSVSQYNEEKSCKADLGAQYITTTPENKSKYEEIYNSLLEDNIIEKLSVFIHGMKSYSYEVEHFVAPEGMNSLVKYFLRTIPKENIYFNERVISIERESEKFIINTNTKKFETDIVVSTIPIPQVLLLQGIIDNCENCYDELQSVSYSSRFAIILFYDKNIQFPDMKWACKYLNHDIFRYVSIDNLKRNKPNQPVAVVLHTSTEFGKQHLEKTLNEVEQILMEAIKNLFPSWPLPSAVKCHKWRYSQVLNSFNGKPGFFILRENPTLILGGDAFSESTFDGCIFSAKSISNLLTENYLT